MRSKSVKPPKSKSYEDWLKDIQTLHDEAEKAVWRIGYVRAEIKNEDTNRSMSNSFSGHALLVAHYAVVDSLLMFCARVWDKSANTISLRHCMKCMPSSSELYDRQVEKGYIKAGPNAEAKINTCHDRFLEKYEKVLNHPAHPHINAMRHERLAHRIYECRDRLKMEDEIEPATLNQLVELSTETVRLISFLGLLSNSVSINHVERVDRAEEYCRTFWRVMPRLADAEK